MCVLSSWAPRFAEAGAFDSKGDEAERVGREEMRKLPGGAFVCAVT